MDLYFVKQVVLKFKSYNLIKNVSLIFVGLILLNFYNLQAQENKQNKIIIHKSFWGSSYEYNENRIKLRELKLILKKVPETTKNLGIANNLRIISNVFGFSGLSLIGLSIISAEMGNPNWNIALFGSAVLIPGFVLQFKATKKYEKAINIYNKIITNKDTFTSTFKILIRNNRVTISCTF